MNINFADVIIVIIVIAIVGFILWSQWRKKDDDFCARCSYNKSCHKDDCEPKVKGRFD